MLEPVAKLSSITAVENSLVLHRISSSQKRAEVHHQDAGRREEGEKEVSIAHTIQRVVRQAGEAQQLPHAVTVERIGGARQRAGAQGHGVGLVIGVLKARYISHEHLRVGHQVKRQRDGLRLLQVRVAGHDGVQVLLGEGAEQRKQR